MLSIRESDSSFIVVIDWQSIDSY